MATIDAPARARARSGGGSAMQPWWGAFQFEENGAGLWELGPLTLGIERLAYEWRLGWSHDADRDIDIARVAMPLEADALPPGGEVARFAVGANDGELSVEPVLPDRDVVAKPDGALHVLGGQEVTLHVAIPISLRLLVVGQRALIEVPTQRLRETWRGRTPASGELCWAAPALARLRPEELVNGAHHALVAVTLHNRADAALMVERISVPVTHLPLWHEPSTGLCAAGVRIDRDADGDTAQLAISSTPPVEGATLVRAGRQPEPRLALVRALEALLD